jgi:hypothetical protein
MSDLPIAAPEPRPTWRTDEDGTATRLHAVLTARIVAAIYGVAINTLTI